MDVDLLFPHKKTEGEINSSTLPAWDYEITTISQEVLKGTCIFPCKTLVSPECF